MRLPIPQRVRDMASIIGDAGHVVFGTVAELFWVEVDAVSGHRSALRERLDVLRSSDGTADMVAKQIDLMPVSARPIPRTRAERQHTVSKFNRGVRELSTRLRASLTPTRG